MKRTHLMLPAVVLLLILGSACDQIELQAITGPPPTRVGSIDNTEGNHQVYISKGVAMAVRCWDSCDARCKSAAVTASSDLVQVHSAYRFADTRSEVISTQSYQNQTDSTFVIVGKQLGNTQLKVRSSCGTQTYSVAVVE